MYLSDEIDFSAYERETDCKAKVRRASVFREDLDAEFAPRTGRMRSVMDSTKLRTAIEFRPSEVTVWAGFNGHRKSMFTGQVALDLCQQNERSLMVSLEMSPRKTLGRMARQALAASSPSHRERDVFLQWTENRLWLFDHVGRLTPGRCLAVCRYFAQELHGRHVFIDSMMKVCQSEESMDEQKILMGDLCDVAKETGLHIHLVAHCRKPGGTEGETKPPTRYDIRGSASISDQAFNIITVWQDRGKRAESKKRDPDAEVMKRPDALVTIEKQRNGDFEGRFGLWFDDQTLRFCDDALSRVEPYAMELL